MAYDKGPLAADAPPPRVSAGAGDWVRPAEDRPVPPVDPVGSGTGNDAAGARKGRATAGRAAREIVETLLLALVIFLAVRLVVLNFRVDGHSMDPNLDDAQMLLVNRNAYLDFDLNKLRNLLPGEDRDGTDVVYPFDPPERGDIVVFEPPEDSDQPYIKRVIALPGEEVSFADGRVLIDGRPLEEPYIEEPTECDGPRRRCTATVPEGSVFVMGDNRDNSQDSRVFGPIDVDTIVGKAWLSYWPLDDLGLVPHYDYPGVAER